MADHAPAPNEGFCLAEIGTDTQTGTPVFLLSFVLEGASLIVWDGTSYADLLEAVADWKSDGVETLWPNGGLH